MRLCDLPLSLEKSSFYRCILHLYRELDFKGLRFRPHFWVSDEFFCPEGIPGIAIPFYLLHPRLQKLEKEMMLEVEGADFEEALRILRHETGHALEHAYQLHKRRKRQMLFGSTRLPYPEVYTPRPFSRAFVQNLGNGYAQAHPDEDFAETFAVWLDPFSNWETRYAGWPAYKKLTYMDELVEELAEQSPQRRNQRVIDDISSLRHTLRTHYHKKQERYGLSRPIHVHDADLLKVFSRPPLEGTQHTEYATLLAYPFIRKHRRAIRQQVSYWTGQYHYLVNQVLDTLSQRCRDLKLTLKSSESDTLTQLTLLVVVKTMKYVNEGGYKVVL